MIKKHMQLVNLKFYTDDRGSLAVLNNISGLPFNVKRIYLLDSNDEQIRGNHGHYVCEQYLCVLEGQIEYFENPGQPNDSYVILNQGEGLLIRKGYWHFFKSIRKSRCLVLASHEYDPNDYFFDRPKVKT